MKTEEATVLTNLADLVSLIDQRVEARTRIVGIDGKDGVGKSHLAAYLASRFSGALVSVDDFINKNSGRYIEALRLHELSARVSTTTLVFIEGVCLLQACELANITLDLLIYVKRMTPEGIWADEEECGGNGSADELIDKLNNDLRLFQSYYTETRVDLSIEIPQLEKEIIRYHCEYRPQLLATVIYERTS